MNESKNPKLTVECFDQLIEAEKYEQIGRLVGGLAHNIQSPLTAIKGYAQLIKADHPELTELNLIVEETGVLQKLAHHLLLKARWLQDRSEKLINLNTVIETEIAFLNAHLIFKHKVRKQVDLDPELPMFRGVYADFSQIVHGVLLNSTDAMVDSNDKQIQIRTRHDDESVYFEVEDSGRGVSDPERLFDWFHTTKTPMPDPSDDKKPVGTGRGLPGIKQLLAGYEGEIVLMPSGNGTICRIRIPVQKY